MRNIHHVDVHDEALKFFGLKRDPFNWLPERPADFFYGTDMALVEITCWRTLELPGIAAIIGAVGSGKSAAVRRFVEHHLARKKQYIVSHVDVPQLRRLDMGHICHKILHDFRNDMHYGVGLLRVAEAVRDAVEDLAEEGVRPLLIIEDAHLLGSQPLRELKLLYELRRRIKPILAILLVGQPELYTRLQREDMRQLAQRTRLHRVQGLGSDLIPYVKHRFRKVSQEATDLFEPDALRELAAQPGLSTPLEVNALGAQACNSAWRLGAARVSREMMFTVLSAYEDERPTLAVPAGVAAPADKTGKVDKTRKAAAA